MRDGLRRAILVVGMHRSGTSALAGAAVRLGLTPPRNPIPPGPDNEAGFYESAPVANLNHILLEATGSSWYKCLHMDSETFDEPARQAAFEMAIRVLYQEFGDAPAFVMKDPRLCMTLPVWLPVLRMAGIAPAILLPVRHPDEVARSLFRRDRLPLADSAAVWLHHMLEAERVTRGLPRAFVRYDALMSDWRATLTEAARTADFTWPAAGPAAGASVDAFLRPDLRHHRVHDAAPAVGAPDLLPLLEAGWRILRGMSADPGGGSALDPLRAAFALWRLRRIVPGAGLSFPTVNPALA
jgi:hypothetical protein